MQERWDDESLLGSLMGLPQDSAGLQMALKVCVSLVCFSKGMVGVAMGRKKEAQDRGR